MVDDVTLSPETYRVFIRIPACWWSEQDAVADIAAVLEETQPSVRKRLQHLIALRLVERRLRQTITPTAEIRKVGK